MTKKVIKHKKPFFLKGSKGPLFCIYYPPSIGRNSDYTIIIVPPFGEEMNKARRMMSLQARALSDVGFGCVLFDLFGTGDSSGEFSASSWNIWKSDLNIISQWVSDQNNTNYCYLTLRLGSLLALDSILFYNLRPAAIALWQPIISGSTAMRQILRLYSLRNFHDQNNRTNTQAILKKFEQDKSLEVAGYEINIDLYHSINNIELSNFTLDFECTALWSELCLTTPAAISPASSKICDKWQKTGTNIVRAPLTGPAFWASTDIIVVDKLITLTTNYFSEINA